MLRAFVAFGVLICVAPTLIAQPQITGVFNEARRICCDMTAPGSVTLIGGFGLGPAMPQVNPTFPLATTLAGVSVRVSTVASTLDAYVLAVESEWVRILLPGNTPSGDASVVVTYNGQASAPRRIRVLPRHFGIYDVGYEGPGFSPLERTVQNQDLRDGRQLNSLVRPARPSEFVVLWGTGLGAAAGNEAAAPIPGRLETTGMEVMVAGRPARIVYAGRSGCCAGMDEIVIQVPAGIEGCNVPVSALFADGSASNEIVVAIASGTGACSDPHGLTESQVRAMVSGDLQAAWIGAAQEPEGVRWVLAFSAAGQTNRIPYGACRLGWYGVSGFTVASTYSLRDAGPAITIRTPQGSVEAPRLAAFDYRAVSSGQIDPGVYVFDNGAGGPDVGAFRAEFTLPRQSFTWLNSDDIRTVTPSEGFTVSWHSADPDAGSVVISVSSGGNALSCVERAGKGGFTVPERLLQVMRQHPIGDEPPDSVSISVSLQVSRRLSAPGIPFVEFGTTIPGGDKTVPLR